MIFRSIDSDLVSFILHIYQNGYVTATSQKIYTGFKYYMTIWNLRDLGLIMVKGTINGRKAWTLTDKGIAVAEAFKILREKKII